MAKKARFAFTLGAMLMIGTGCSNAPPGTYAELDWTIRCEGMRGCLSYMPRSVAGFDGENQIRITCSVTETDSSRSLGFSVNAAGYGFSLQRANFPLTGGSPTAGSCLVTVREDNTYTGACGGATPSPTQPCQVSDVDFTRDGEGRSLITGLIYCGGTSGDQVFGLSPSAAPTIKRELTTPGTDIASRTTPMRFSLYDCPGFNPD
jgi:hypothetical protein